jgi:hypothetical protein
MSYRLIKVSTQILKAINSFVFSILYFPLRDKKILFVSYYADFGSKKYYEVSAKRLEKKLNKWGLRTDFVKLNDLGGYRANTLYKPEFIYRKLIEHKTSIIWIDCDTDPYFPWVFYRISKIKGIALVSKLGDLNNSMGGLLKFEYNKESFKLIRRWWLHCVYARKNGILELDHDALKHAIIPALIGKVKLNFLKVKLKEVGFISSTTEFADVQNLHLETTKIDSLRSQINSLTPHNVIIINSVNQLDQLILEIENMVVQATIEVVFNIDKILYIDKLEYLNLLLGD